MIMVVEAWFEGCLFYFLNSWGWGVESEVARCRKEGGV